MRYPFVYVLCFVLLPIIGKSQIQLQEAFPNLTFTRPVDLQNAGDGSNRLFVVEQHGVIQVFTNDSLIQQKFVFLDISDRVNSIGNEEGLLGLAFHPDFASNDYFYVYYTASNPRRSVISRFRANGASADPSSEMILLEVNQPESNHNGGQLAFGPDRYLYIALGDGGGAGDQHGSIGNGQDRSTLLGSILRINIEIAEGNQNYSIPKDNPFVGNKEGYREEIYAYGFRNPWRFSLDKETGTLWAADVGQNQYEEINLVEAGSNCGWRITEGMHCYNPSSGCDMSGIHLPIWEYDHSEGQSITGGYIYRGASVPELMGQYIYADYVQGKIWALQYDGLNTPSNLLLTDTDLFISSFGVDENRELYICTFNGTNSKIYRFQPGTFTHLGELPPRYGELEQNYPNPFMDYTEIPFSLEEPARVQIQIFDAAGRLIETLLPGNYYAGNHRITWYPKDDQGRKLPEGNYLYQIRANGKVIGSRYMTIVN